MRQYVYLADQPVAIIDMAQGGSIAAQDTTSTLAQIGHDLVTAAKDWFGSTASIAYLHTNHLGATEVVSDTNGDAIWRAEYQPYGKVVTVNALANSENPSADKAKPTKPLSFELHLRLPGQYEDDETGLYYNDYRYYDPARGQYLTPDPIGLRGGVNSYAYVHGNPLKYVDPLGLILFAFDGSNNSNPPPINKTGAQDDFSNVYKFYLAYDAELNGPAWYMNGVGRDDPESGIKATFADGANGYTARSRVDYMLSKLDDYIATTAFTPGERVNIDIVGFSRGAAMGRDFSNRVAERLKKNAFDKSGACVQIRFMGLWDTVAQFGENGIANGQWQLAIPPEAQYVFHAVALNENRYLFPGESIGRGTQRGFIGSHADIGGSYGTGDLSNVALNWIVEEAKKSGVKMFDWGKNGTDIKWGTVTDPVLHDKSIGTEDRSFCLRKNNEFFVTNCQRQRQATPGGMTWSDTQTGNFITRYDKTTMDADGSSKIIGEVDMKVYGAWLKQNYGLVIP